MARTKAATLNSEKVVAAAIAMIGEHGLEAFSMPKLADALGVRTPSLYYHFADRSALLAEVARVVATPAPPAMSPSDTHWTDYLVRVSVALRRTIVAHPHCAPLLVQFMPRGNMFHESELMCRYLAAAGVPARLHLSVIDGMTAMTVGSALLRENSASYTATGDGPTPDPDEYPALDAALSSVGDDPEERFELYLRTYLDRIIAQMHEEQHSSAGR